MQTCNYEESVWRKREVGSTCFVQRYSDEQHPQFSHYVKKISVGDVYRDEKVCKCTQEGE